MHSSVHSYLGALGPKPVRMMPIPRRPSGFARESWRRSTSCKGSRYRCRPCGELAPTSMQDLSVRPLVFPRIVQIARALHRTSSARHRTFFPPPQREFDVGSDVRGLIEGFLGGSVEVLLFENEFAVVVYHVSLRDSYPVSVPVGFISAEQDVVTSIGKFVRNYIESTSGFERPNDCGLISKIGRGGQ